MDNYTMIISVLRAIVLIAVTYFAYRIASYSINNKQKFKEMTVGTVNRALDRSKSFYFNNENLTALLSKYGVMAMFNDYRLEPSTFVIIKAALAFVFAVLGAMINVPMLGRIACAIAGGLVGFWMPDILIRISNKDDNENMLDDILEMYDILKIYTKAGAHVKEALIECQLQVKNKRLKTGLQELNNNIISGQVTMREAIDIFNARFANDNIDDLCVILKQALVTGRSAKILSDISRQLYDIRHAKSILDKEKMDRKMQTIQLLFFVGLVALLIYVIGIELISSINSF